MGRPHRVSQGGYAYHILNRANGRMRIFGKDGDYQAFERVLTQAKDRFPMPVLAFCLLPNHWHLLLWPQQDDLLSPFMNWLTLTHTQRWHAERRNVGSGHVYQGRFKSFVIQEDDHFLTVCRYVERNALRAGLVSRAEEWRWSSLWRRHSGTAEEASLLSPWPVACPKNWLQHVNRVQTEAELAALRRCVRRGQPFGGDAWVNVTASQLGLEATLRPPGRPKKVGKRSGNGS